MQCGQKLAQVERVAGGLAQQGPRQINGPVPADGQRGLGDPGNRLQPKRRQVQHGARQTARLDAADQRGQGMGVCDLVGPIGADDGQVPRIRGQGEVLDHLERRRIGPLQVVQKQHGRDLDCAKGFEKPANCQLKPLFALTGVDAIRR